MANSGSIAALQRNRKLSTPEAAAAFDEALQELAQAGPLTRADLRVLFRVFDDTCDNEEVMFGLVHLLEDSPLEEFLAGVLDVVKDLDATAPGWAKLFHYRIVNSESARSLYASMVRSAPEATRATVGRILRSIVSEEGDPLKGRAQALLDAASL